MKINVHYTLHLTEEIEVSEDTVNCIRENYIDCYSDKLIDEIISKLDTLGDNDPFIDSIYSANDEECLGEYYNKRAY